MQQSDTLELYICNAQYIYGNQIILPEIELGDIGDTIPSYNESKQNNIICEMMKELYSIAKTLQRNNMSRCFLLAFRLGQEPNKLMLSDTKNRTDFSQLHTIRTVLNTPVEIGPLRSRVTKISPDQIYSTNWLMLGDRDVLYCF